MAPQDSQTPTGDPSDRPWGSFHVVLLEPEIPHNTGAAGRLCLATGATLHLVGKLGFDISERAVRKAGLDYWERVDLQTWDSWETFAAAHPVAEKGHFLTTKRGTAHWDTTYAPGDYLIFGAESRGLPESLLDAHPDRCRTIPMQPEGVRSLNLATSIATVLYEASRQLSRS